VTRTCFPGLSGPGSLNYIGQARAMQKEAGPPPIVKKQKKGPKRIPQIVWLIKIAGEERYVNTFYKTRAEAVDDIESYRDLPVSNSIRGFEILKHTWDT